MASLVWRKIQHQHKRATKMRFEARFRELTIDCSPKWQPAAVRISWVHRKRRYLTKSFKWEPSIANPYSGIIVWPAQNCETLDIVTTLYRDLHAEQYDDKEWTFYVEEVNGSGKKCRPIACAGLNMRMFVNDIPGAVTQLKLQLRPLRENLKRCTLQLLLFCSILKEGAALEDDMRSLASVMSSQPCKDVADLHEFDDDFSSKGSLAVLQSSEPTTTNGFLKSEICEVVDSIERLKTVPSVERVDDDDDGAAPELLDDVDVSKKVERPASLATNQADRSPRHSGPIMTSTPTAMQQSSGFFDTILSTSVDSKVESSSNVDTTSVSATAAAAANITSQDLLSWCQEVCRGYRGVRVANFNTSWRNGLAFAALIHHYRPDLIDYDSLRPADIGENCRKAFDAASLLNVPRLIDPNDMVIMTVPDKIAVMTYVYNLKAALTGATPVHAQDYFDGLYDLSKLSQSSGRPASIVSMEMFAVAEVPAASPKKSPPPKNDPLMTRQQFMNPFDSDEDTPNMSAAVSASSPVQHESLPTTNLVAEPAVTNSRQEELRRRVRQMIDNFGDDEHFTSDEKRRQELTARARQLVLQHGCPSRVANAGVVIRMSDAVVNGQTTGQQLLDNGQRIARLDGNKLARSAPVSCVTSPEYKCQPAASSAGLPSPITKESLLMSATGTSSPSSCCSSSPVAALPASTATESAFARFKRFGSMRSQELTQSINFLSSHLHGTSRNSQTSKPDDAMPEVVRPPTKIDTPLDLELQLKSVTAEMEALVVKQNQLDHRAIEVEKQWRQVMQEVPGSEEEQRLMNEFLSLLNERNMLTRREMHLSLLETIRSYETRFNAVQTELGQLIGIEECEKTEVHKQRIDFLMDELISIVNKRDELVQQLMAHDQGTEEDAEMADTVLKNSIMVAAAAASAGGVATDQKNCVIQ